MKKNYFLLAASTMMFAACAQTDMVNEVVTEEAPQAIGFETFSNKITRQVSNATALESYHNDFGVWAYKTVNGTTTSVMGNYKVEGTGTPAKWTYASVDGQSLKYWDKQATSYGFYAYAPYAASPSVVNITNDYKITIANGQYAATENLQKEWTTQINTNDFSTDTDWMIAETDQTKEYKNYGTEVPEIFKHTMSKLIVILKSNDVKTGTEVTVTSVSVNNVHGAGSYNGTKWTATDNGKSITGVAGKFESTTGYYSMEYLLIPSADDPTFSIEYEVNGDKYTVTGAEIEGITEFKENTCYTLTATIGLSPIVFTATASGFEKQTPDGDVTIQ